MPPGACKYLARESADQVVAAVEWCSDLGPPDTSDCVRMISECAEKEVKAFHQPHLGK